MAISGVGSNYGNVYGSTYMAQKNEVVKKTETKEAAPAQAKNAFLSQIYTLIKRHIEKAGNRAGNKEQLK